MATATSIGPLIYDPTGTNRSPSIAPISPLLSGGGSGQGGSGGTAKTATGGGVNDLLEKAKTIGGGAKKAWDVIKELFPSSQAGVPPLSNTSMWSEFASEGTLPTMNDVSPIFQSNVPTNVLDPLTGQIDPFALGEYGTIPTSTLDASPIFSMYEGLSPSTLSEISGAFAPASSIVPTASAIASSAPFMQSLPTLAGISSGIEGGIAAGTAAGSAGSAAGTGAAALAPLAAYLGPIGAFLGGALRLGTQLYGDQQEKKATTKANNQIEQMLTASPEAREQLFKGLASLTPMLSETRAYDPGEQNIFSGVPNRMVTSALQDMFKGDVAQMDKYDPSKRLSTFWKAQQTFQKAQNARQEAAVNPIFSTELRSS